MIDDASRGRSRSGAYPRVWNGCAARPRRLREGGVLRVGWDVGSGRLASSLVHAVLERA